MFFKTCYLWADFSLVQIYLQHVNHNYSIYHWQWYRWGTDAMHRDIKIVKL